MLDPITAGTITAIAKAIEAIFTYMTEHERGLTPDQRAAQNQLALDAHHALKDLGERIAGLIPKEP
jgi:hypothetical protein